LVINHVLPVKLGYMTFGDAKVDFCNRYVSFIFEMQCKTV